VNRLAFLYANMLESIQSCNGWMVSSHPHSRPECIPCFRHTEDKFDKSVSMPTTLFFIYKFTPSWNHAKLLKRRKLSYNS